MELKQKYLRAISGGIKAYFNDHKEFSRELTGSVSMRILNSIINLLPLEVREEILDSDRKLNPAHNLGIYGYGKKLSVDKWIEKEINHVDN